MCHFRATKSSGRPTALLRWNDPLRTVRLLLNLPPGLTDLRLNTNRVNLLNPRPFWPLPGPIPSAPTTRLRIMIDMAPSSEETAAAREATLIWTPNPPRYFHRARRRASSLQHVHSLRQHANRRNRLFALFPCQPSPRHAGRIHQYRRTEHRPERACYESDPAQLLSNIISNEQRYHAAPRPRPERTTILFTLGRDRDSKSESAASAGRRGPQQRRGCRPSPPRIHFQARPLNSYH